MTISANLILRSQERGTLLECPLWCARTNSLYWIDVMEPSVQLFNFDSGRSDRWGLPKPPGSISLVSATRLLVAMRAALAYLGLASGQLEPVAWHGPALGKDRFNDGVTDRQGNF
jgi:L-arabinonolactonase